MRKLDMSGFKYRNYNTIKFDGYFGSVELTYIAKDGEAESHFVAELNTKSYKGYGVGLTEGAAIIDLYLKYAKYKALEDLGVS
jgi:hypothetical protein